MTLQFPDNVEQWMPHRGRMRMVERAVSMEDGRGVLEARVRESWPLCDGGRVPSLVVIDLVAQSAAVYASWERQLEKRPGGRGFIVGVRKTDWSAPTVPVGALLRVELLREVIMDNYAAFIGEVTMADGDFQARVELQTFRTEEQEPGAPGGSWPQPPR